jgi:hypothetical protein
LERPLEAALVFQEALTTFKGDAQFDSQNANGFYVSANQLKRKLKDDPLIDALSKSANQAKLDNPGEGGGAGEIMYANASRALDQDKDYATARDLFKRVPTDAESYEKALVYVGVCEYMLGQPKRDFAAAIGVFDDYLDQYLKDPRHALGPTETRKEFRRGEATAVAVYYRGLSEFYLAEAGKGDWKRVVDLLSGFETRFPAQKDLAPAAMYRVILAQCHLGKQQEVDAGYVRLRELFASNKFTVMAAQEIFGMLDADFGKLKDSKDPADRVKAKALQAKMAEYLEFANQNSSTPSFNNLRRESQLWRDLERWPKAEALLRKLEEKYESGPNAADVQKYVLPDLGVACFKQQKMQDAVDILGPLVEQKKATFAITLVYAHALSGYAEQVTLENQSSMRVVAGVASLDAFTKATELYGELLETEKNRDGGGAWTSGWLELKFDQIYCLHEWSKIDSKRAESALTQIKSLQTEFDGPELPSLKDADLKAKFKWLIGELK